MNRSVLSSLSRRAAVSLAIVALVAGCASTPKPMTVGETIAANPSLSTLSGLVKSAGLTDSLNGDGPFTVFAPNNDAFKAVPAKTMEALGKDPEALKGVLMYHVVPGKIMAADVKTGKVKTLQGDSLEVAKAGDFVTVGESGIVTQANIDAGNGVVHIMDAVALPPAKKK